MLVLAALALAFPAHGRVEAHLVAKVPDGCRVVDGSLRFSRDGKSCIYVVTQGEKQHPVVGGMLGSAFDEVSWPTIDPTGAHTAFRLFENNPHKKVGTYSVLYDGKVLVSDTWVGPLAMDPAKGAVAFWIAHGYSNTADGHLEPGVANFVWGKYKTAKYQFFDRNPPQFAPEGGLVVTTAARGSGDWNVITVDEKGKEDRHGTGSIFEAAVRPTGHAVAYTLVQYLPEGWYNHPQHFVIVTVSLDEHDDKTPIGVYGDKYSAAGSPCFTPDGLHLAFKVWNGTKMGAAKDEEGTAPCEYDFVEEISPKPNGTEVAFTACNGGKFEAKNGREVLFGAHAKGGKWFVVHGSVRLGEYQLARLPTWSRDGNALAYAAQIDGKWHAFAGTKRSEPCDEIACLAWSEDGRTLYFGCRDGAELWWRKLEGE